MQTLITPVQVYPSSANTLYIRAGNLGPPPEYYYELQAVTVLKGSPAVGVEGEKGYVPAVSDSTEVILLKNGNASMTEQQWSSWPANLGPEGDDNYQLDSICANLGLTRA